MTKSWMQFSVIVALLMGVISLLPVEAQSNLLSNPGFESGYSGRMGRGDFNFPEGWGGWFTTAPQTEAWMNQPPNAFPHTSSFKYSGTSSLSISKGSGTFTAATYQEVGDIEAGTVLRGSAFVFIENANGSNAQVRIGIGSNVGSNVNGAITWSGWVTQLNNYQQISVDHVATGGSVTLFIYATQTWPNDPNAVYFDEASLVTVGEGQAPASGGNGSADAPVSQPSGVAFVSPQDTEEDDGIQHTVVSGDTVASIAVAYGVTVDEILALNNLDRGSFLQIGQVLVVAEPSVQPTATVEVTEEVDVTDDAETSDEPEATEDLTPRGTTVQQGAVITEFTETPPPAESPTSENTPTETPVPDTATPAPTAPVAEADTQGVDPTELDPGICVAIFEDDNQNGVLEPGEANLADGVIAVMDSDDTEVGTHTTTADPIPFCFDDLDAGRYTLNATAPDGYGLTTSPVLRANLEDGDTVTVRFGAKQGLAVLAIPTVDTSNPTAEPEPETGTVGAEDPDIADFSGLIVFGLAGMVLVIGMGASLLMRRR